jgi:hypothetical protein
VAGQKRRGSNLIEEGYRVDESDLKKILKILMFMFKDTDPLLS